MATKTNTELEARRRPYTVTEKEFLRALIHLSTDWERLAAHLIKKSRGKSTGSTYTRAYDDGRMDVHQDHSRELKELVERRLRTINELSAADGYRDVTELIEENGRLANSLHDLRNGMLKLRSIIHEALRGREIDPEIYEEIANEIINQATK